MDDFDLSISRVRSSYVTALKSVTYAPRFRFFELSPERDNAVFDQEWDILDVETPVMIYAIERVPDEGTCLHFVNLFFLDIGEASGGLAVEN